MSSDVPDPLRDNEERLRLALTGTNLGVYDLDVRTGRVIFTPEYATILGYDPAGFDITIDRWAEALHPDDRERVVSLLQSCIRGDVPRYSVEYRMRTRDGQWKWIQSVGKTVTPPGADRPTRLLGIHLDIAERKQAEAVLLESRRLYEELVSSVPLGVYRVQPAPDDTFTFVYASDRYCDTIGLPRDVVLNERGATVALIPPEDRAEFERTNRDAIRNLAPFEWEGRVMVRGEMRWLHVASRPSTALDGQMTWTGVAFDITDRKRADERLEMFQFATDQAADAVFWMDRDAHFLYVNDEACETLGYTHDELLELSLFDIDPGYPRALWNERWQEFHGGREEWDCLESAHRRKDGTIFPVEIWARHLVLGTNEVHVAFARDITDRRAAVEQRLDLERRLLHAQKLESLGVLAGGIAHDFNNLLMAIQGNLELALARMSPLAPARTSVEQSLAAARKATDLTRQMLAYSGNASFDIKAVDLSQLVEENAHLLRTSISKIVSLTLDLDRALPPVKADAGQLQQVIMNLITNASEAIGDQPGMVTLRTGTMTCDDEVLSRSRTDEIPPAGRFAFVEVSDTGCGMDGYTQDRLFEPFFSTKFVGRGLGMSAILGIVRGHKGAIFIDSTVGKGSTVRALFPEYVGPVPDADDKAADKVSTDAEARPAPPPANTRASRTILVVDDEELVRNVCRRMLEHLGWNVLEAPDGPTAVEVFRARGHEIACALVDLSMPHMDGIEVFRKLRAIRPDVKVLLSSGYAKEYRASERSLNEGVDGFIQKPYSAKHLRSELDRLLG
jgi:PAS domain S-box-containing protein